MNDANHIRVAPTALLVAHFRRYGGDPLSEQIAEATKARKAALNFFDGDEEKLKQATAWIPLIIEMRQKGVNALVKMYFDQTGHRNLFEVGAGVALENVNDFARDNRVKHILTDYSGDLVLAQRLLVEKFIPGTNGNLKISRLNALDEHQTVDALEFFGGEPYAKTHLGILPYFTVNQMARYFEVSAKTMPPGSKIITTNIITKDRVAMMIANKPERAKLIAKIRGMTTEQLFNDAYENDDQAIQQITNSGLRVEQRIPQYHGLGYNLSSTARIELEGIKVNQDDINVMGKRQIWIIAKD